VVHGWGRSPVVHRPLARLGPFYLLCHNYLKEGFELLSHPPLLRGGRLRAVGPSPSMLMSASTRWLSSCVWARASGVGARALGRVESLQRSYSWSSAPWCCSSTGTPCGSCCGLRGHSSRSSRSRLATPR
jgi:hypothetical protein